MKNTTTDLPPELQAFASLFDAQPPEVQDASQFLPATAMHGAGKFELVSVADDTRLFQHIDTSQLFTVEVT